jgi:hypothetical protein
MKKVCSFCGRSEKDVKLLITGLSGFICEDCAQQAYEIVQSTGLMNNGKKEEAANAFKLTDVPKPKKIKEYLDQYVIGQMKQSAICLFLFTITISALSNRLMITVWKLKRVTSLWLEVRVRERLFSLVL